MVPYRQIRNYLTVRYRQIRNYMTVRYCQIRNYMTVALKKGERGEGCGREVVGRRGKGREGAKVKTINFPEK